MTGASGAPYPSLTESYSGAPYPSSIGETYPGENTGGDCDVDTDGGR